MEENRKLSRMINSHSLLYPPIGSNVQALWNAMSRCVSCLNWYMCENDTEYTSLKSGKNFALILTACYNRADGDYLTPTV